MTPTLLQPSDYDTLLKLMVQGAEGDEPRPYKSSDDTITLGYGYTFLRMDPKRGWSIYKYLYADLATPGIGITLTPTEKGLLADIK